MPKIISVTGGAGAGKTTYSLNKSDNVYSIDTRFIGDPLFRINLLNAKSSNVDDYIDACNQYNWWNWDLIIEDIKKFISGNDIIIKNGYDRLSGEFNHNKILSWDKDLIIEGSILGYDIPEISDYIIYLNVDSNTRLSRLIDKDKNRRSGSDIAARFLITEYSEGLYYNWLLSNYSDKIRLIGDCNKFESDSNKLLPFDITKRVV